MAHFTSGEELLNAACALLVEEVAVEPGFRRLVRTAYYRYWLGHDGGGQSKCNAQSAPESLV